MIIDFHSHVLPGVDDGSRNMETSINMLETMKQQGVDIVIATPHFYAYEHRLESWKKRRDEAASSFSLEGIRMFVGCEVAFFDGISKADIVEELTIEGSRVLLLEMPFGPWYDSIIDEVEYLVKKRNFTVILAHIERYFNQSKKLLDRLLSLDLYVQVNAESVLHFKTRSKVLKMIKQGSVQLLGSDCHGMHHRVPNLKDGRDVIEKKLGRSMLDRIDAEGSKLLEVILHE